MPMDDARLFSILAQCFGPASQDDWNDATGIDVWQALLSRLRLLLQDGGAWGMPAAPVVHAQRTAPLQEFLAAKEVDALFVPPSFDEKRAFAVRHFTGGLPQSAVPVESLYVEWTNDPARGPFAHQTGLYDADTALYMRDLLASLGIELSKDMAAYPDHLSLELDLVSLLLDAGRAGDARQLLIERTQWLTAYRMKLVALGDEALFYLALVDALLGIRAQQEALGVAGREPSAKAV